jgi:cysteinyl-tRNA synthetase
MLRIYNSLTKEVEDFQPIDPDRVGVYTCGPTVYHFAHIGNFRTYTTSDILVRTLAYNGYKTKYIMNLTDVGHLTGDNMGDADTGEDRMEKTAKSEGKTAWEVAEFYTEAFLEEYEKLHLSKPEKFTKATDHIQEQVELVSRLEEKGYTYRTSDGIYFDTSKFPDYGKLSNLDEIKEGARVEVNPEKKNPRDFALWKFSYPGGKTHEEYAAEIATVDSVDLAMTGKKEISRRQMEWKSPWGVGFPGWHIECSAMAMKYLGETFDIHVGGIDLKSTHHPNEIAQSEAATGVQFVNYWVHSSFMLVQGEKMSKSKGNVYRVYDLEKEDYDPLALRYLYLQTHYRQEMNFTFPALDAAQNTLARLREIVVNLDAEDGEGASSVEFEERFVDAINDDLNTPQALAVMWEMVRSDVSDAAKLKALLRFDAILGFDLLGVREHSGKIKLEDLPIEIQNLINEREQYRREKRYTLADKLRLRLKKIGYDILDTEKGIEIKRI